MSRRPPAVSLIMLLQQLLLSLLLSGAHDVFAAAAAAPPSRVTGCRADGNAAELARPWLAAVEAGAWSATRRGAPMKTDDGAAASGAGRWAGAVWPQPVDASPPPSATAAAVVLGAGFVFGAQPDSMDQAGVLQRAMARFGPRVFQWGAPSGAGATDQGSAAVLRSATVVVAQPDVVLGPDIDESYSITVNCSSSLAPAASVHAETVWGAIWALETFVQLPQVSDARNTTAYWLPCTAVTDRPRFRARAAMVDCSRNWVSIPALMQFVDVMSANKQNMLHLHINDMTSWPLEIKAYPLLAERGALSASVPGLGARRTTWLQSDVRRLVRYATDRGVRLVPELDFPTHSDGPLQASYPQFLTAWTDAQNRSWRSNFDATSEEAWNFYEAVWTEVADLFPDAEVHIGGDEVDLEPWNRSLAVAAWARKYATACPDDPTLRCDSVAALVKYFARRAVATVARLGKRAIAWYGFESAIVDAYGASPGDYGRAPTQLTLDDWDGWNPQGPVFWQPGLAKLSYANQNTTMLLSGPFYVVAPEQRTNNVHQTWQDMYRVDARDWRDTSISTSHAPVNDWAKPTSAVVKADRCTSSASRVSNGWSVPPANTSGPVKIRLGAGGTEELCLDSSQGTAGTLLAAACNPKSGAQLWQFRELVPGTGIGHLFNAGGFGCDPWACPSWCPGVAFVPPPLFTCCAQFRWVSGVTPESAGGTAEIERCYDANYPEQRIRLEPAGASDVDKSLVRIRNVPLPSNLGDAIELCLAVAADATRQYPAAAEAAAKQRVRGTKLCLWGDTAHADSASLLSVATTNLMAMAQASWSPNGTTAQLPSAAMVAQRCRLAARGYPSLQSGIAGAGAPCPAVAAHVLHEHDEAEQAGLEAQLRALQEENRALRETLSAQSRQLQTDGIGNEPDVAFLVAAKVDTIFKK